MRTRRVVKNKDQLQKYVRATNGKDNITTTVYGFRDLKPKGNRCEYNTAIIPHFVVDLDKDRLVSEGMDDSEAGQQCAEEAWRLSAHLLENQWRHAIWFTGGGFHIWVNLDQEYVLGPKELNDLLVSGRSLISKWVKDMDLKTLDPVVSFRPDRHIRIPNSFNFKRNLWSIPLSMGTLSMGWDTVIQLAQEPARFSIFVMGKVGMPIEIIERDPNNPFGPQGFAKQEFNAEDVEIEMKRIGNIPMLPCLAEATCELGANPPHLPRVYLMMYLLDYFGRFARPPSSSRIPIDDRVNQAHAFISQLKWADYNPEITHKYLKHGAERDYQTPTCPTLYREGLCVGKCPFYDGKGVGKI